MARKKAKRKAKKSAQSAVINVELILAGQQTRSYGITRGQTVADVFGLAGAEMNGEIRLNGRVVNGSDKITADKSRIMAVPRIRGA